MYDELISSLRICGKINSANDNCIAFHDGSCEAEPVCMYELMDNAADAIENTSKAYKMMAEAYEAEVTRQWWIPVTKRLPEEHVFVLIRQDDDRMMVAERVDGDWWYRYFAYDVDRWDENEQGTITHWMPLPQPPKEE